MGEEIAMTVMTEEIKASFALEDSIFSISREELVTEEILKIVSCLGALLTDGFFLFDFDSVEKICECLYFYFVHVKKVSGREDANTSYDLILADPGGDGALFSRLQRLHTGMRVPLVILSTSEQVLQKAWEHQIPWLRKPFRLNALYALVEQAHTMDSLHQDWPHAR